MKCFGSLNIIDVRSFDIMVENLYSFSAVSENIVIPSPPNFGRKESSSLSKLEQLISPVIAGMNSVLTMSSSFYQCLELCA